MFPARYLLLAGLAVVAGGTMGIPGARAQTTAIPTGGPSARPVVSADPDAALPRPVPRPVGIPGSQVDHDTVAPADRPASEMRPTEALFDAINRGDITAARDAINRGADLHGHSILGFTPVELSVDLGRKDITFLLLSLRGMDGGSERASRARAAGGPAATPQSEAQQARAAKLEAQRAEAARRAAARVAPTPGPVTQQNPRLFAGDGGAPVPDAGFLGFGGGGGAGRTR